MLSEGRTYFLSHVVLIPGLTISLAVLGFNLVGDGIRDALDPRLERPLGRLGRRRARRHAAGYHHLKKSAWSSGAMVP